MQLVANSIRVRFLRVEEWMRTGVAISIVLAFFFGYLLTYSGVRRAGSDHATAVRAALVSDTVSITSMEIVDNLVLLVVPGAMAAG